MVDTVTVDGTALTLITAQNTDTVTAEAKNIQADAAVAVTYKAKPAVSFTETEDLGDVTVTATKDFAETEINSGSYVDFGSGLVIEVTPDKGYVVDTVTVDGTALTLITAQNTDTVTAEAENIQADAAVVVTYKAKPAVTVTENEDKGEITVTASHKDFAETEINSGSYVDFGSGLAVEIAPVKGYAVEGVTVNGEAVTLTDVANSDNKTFSVSNVQADAEIAVTYVALDITAVNFAVIDKGEGALNGSITASVDRKGMDIYAVSGDASGLLQVYEGSTVTFAASPEEGFKVTKWFVNGEEVSQQPTLTVTAGMGEQTVEVQFDYVGKEILFSAIGEADKADVTAAFIPNGGTTQDFVSGNKPATPGVVEVSVVDLDENYMVEGWYVNGEKQEGETGLTFRYEVTVDVGAEITVNLIRCSYSVTFSVENGTLTAAAGENAVASGDAIVGDTVITFTALPQEPTGYTFKGWTVNGEASDVTEQTLTVTLTENLDVKAKYVLDIVYYRVTFGVVDTNGEAEGGRNGTLVLNGSTSGSEEFRAGSDLTFTARPADGYRVAGWYSDAEGTMPIDGTAVEQLVYKATNLVDDMTVYVAYEPIPEYTVTLTTDGLGSVTATVNGETADISSGTLVVKRYDTVVLTAVPGEYQYLTGWTVDGAEAGNALALTLDSVTADTTVTAAFLASQNIELQAKVNTDQGSIEVKAGFDAPSVINPATGITIHKGQTVELTVTPNAGMMLDLWLVNGEEVANHLDHTLVIENITEDTVVEAKFTDEVLLDIVMPTEEDGYTVTEIVETPEDYGTETQVRQRGTVTFKVSPIVPNVISEMAVTGGENAILTLNEDGSWTVTVENVQDTIVLQPTVLSGQQLVINCGAGGTVTVTRDGVVMPSGSVLSVGDEIVVKAVGNTGYYLVSLTINGETFRTGNVYTVLVPNETIVVSATFIAGNMGGGGSGGGGGGGYVAPVKDVTVEDSANGTVTASHQQAASGTQVTVTAQPDKGYKTGSVTVTGEDCGAIEVTKNADGTYTFEMPGEAVTVKATFLVDFVDVDDDDYFSNAVDWAVENGITAGTSASNFSPDMACTRAQAVMFLWRAAGSPAPKSTEMPFEDVAADAYYYTAVLWAVEKGVTAGTSATTFSPDQQCTRAQIVTFLWRTQDSPIVSRENPFIDVREEDYFLNPVLWAVENGITAGTAADTFSPANTCTRAQIVTFLWRCFK